MIPISKSGEQGEADNNYDRTSILRSPSEIFEKVPNFSFFFFGEDFQSLSEDQYMDFVIKNRPRKVILKCIIICNTNMGKFPLSKAFDSLDLEISIDQLENIGTRGTPL